MASIAPQVRLGGGRRARRGRGPGSVHARAADGGGPCAHCVGRLPRPVPPARHPGGARGRSRYRTELLKRDGHIEALIGGWLGIHLFKSL